MLCSELMMYTVCNLLSIKAPRRPRYWHYMFSLLILLTVAICDLVLDQHKHPQHRNSRNLGPEKKKTYQVNWKKNHDTHIDDDDDFMSNGGDDFDKCGDDYDDVVLIVTRMIRMVVTYIMTPSWRHHRPYLPLLSMFCHQYITIQYIINAQIKLMQPPGSQEFTKRNRDRPYLPLLSMFCHQLGLEPLIHEHQCLVRVEAWPRISLQRK